MKSKMVFPGIKGLVASGAGMTKKVNHAKVRPEMNQGAMIPQDAMKKMPMMSASKTPMPKKAAGKVSVKSNIRPEGKIKRDSASAIKA